MTLACPLSELPCPPSSPRWSGPFLFLSWAMPASPCRLWKEDRRDLHRGVGSPVCPSGYSPGTLRPLIQLVVLDLLFSWGVFAACGHKFRGSQGHWGQQAQDNPEEHGVMLMGSMPGSGREVLVSGRGSLCTFWVSNRFSLNHVAGTGSWMLPSSCRTSCRKSVHKGHHSLLPSAGHFSFCLRN